MAKFQLNFSQITSGVILPGLILVFFIGGYFVILPKFSSIRSLGNDLKLKQQAGAERASQLAGIQNLVSEYQKSSDELKALDEALPPAPRIPELLANIEYLAKLSGLEVADIQIASAPTLSSLGAGKSLGQVQRAESLLSAAQDLGIMQVEVNTAGQYEAMKNFLTNIEQNMRLLDVQVLAIQEAGEKDEHQGFSLRLQTYYQKQQYEATAAE